MAPPDAGRIAGQGLWSGNAATVQLLGLCPLLAVSTNAVNALGMGVATLLALACTNPAIASLRGELRPAIRLPAFVLVIAMVVTAIELAMHAWLPALHDVLGLFLPLIVTNCAIMARAEAFAAHHSPAWALLDGLAVGAGFLAVLLLLGIAREALGAGTVFAGAGALLGLPGLEMDVGTRGGTLLIAALPPGAFVLLALLVAVQNRLRRPRSAGAEAR